MILMCDPQHFSVEYEINVHMHGNKGRVKDLKAQAQWKELHRLLELRDDVRVVEPMQADPDAVFIANAGFVYGDKALLTNFKFEERRGEESLWEETFAALGLDVHYTEHSFEGAGDCFFDKHRGIIWMGYGFRTDFKAAYDVEEMTDNYSVYALELVDPRFYHLDTCFCPLSDGTIVWYPAAFSENSRRLIGVMTPNDMRIEVSEEDALNFACNAVEAGGHVFANKFSPELYQKLIDREFVPVEVPMDEFMLSGGATKCCVLQLDPVEESVSMPYVVEGVAKLSSGLEELDVPVSSVELKSA